MKKWLAVLMVLGGLMISPLYAQSQCSTLGEQRLLTVIVNGSTTASAVQSAFFGSDASALDQFFRSASWGQTWFTGTIVNVAIQAPSTCDPLTVKDRADAVLAAQGFDFDPYTRRIYIGGVGMCPWQGSVWAFFCNRTTLGGTQYSTLWLNGLGAWTHEMGHIFGAAHNAVPDPMDAMSILSSPFNAPHRVQFNWLTAQNVTASGTYLVSALETATLNPQVLRIQKSASEWYWVSYRQDPSFNVRMTAGVSIHA